ncbi:uncharacterized protein PgNI_12326 [Pyricularia grisea]|uniref:Uncharacterized protein n=1 Tax=Pyricularia grisea TaxID=148305 RepID=A0A6P8AN12_PYRGI|nr:uncharacterized protein PgNI_12326 [Pyricularia grisea]TLD03433.1 hypothetical protein PgNI_12326 [Pyricularia grisea]
MRNDLRLAPEVVGTKLSQGIEKNPWRRVEAAGTRDTTASSSFPKIVLNQPTIVTCRLADCDVAEPNINILIEVRDSTADAD